MPSLHHVTFKVATRITDREEFRAHEILVTAKAFESADNVLRTSDENPAGYYGVWMDVGGWTDVPAAHLLPILKDIFADWKCIVEYLKRFIGYSQSGEPLIHPLIHMDILGNSPTFRRNTLRVSGAIVFGAGIRDEFRLRSWRMTEDGKSSGTEDGRIFD